MAKKKISISVLIPCYNEEKMISACIFSCLEQTRIPDQIVVVNDGSTDNTPAILEGFKNNITVVTLAKPSGNKSRAQEAGIPFVTGEIVVMTDADTVLDSRFIELIERDFMESPDLAVVAGHVRSARHNLLTALRDIDYVIGQDIYKYAQSHLHFISIIPGCAGVFKTSLFKEGVVNFEHDTLTEDLDFTYKINRAGLPIKYNPNAIVHTSDPFTLKSYVNQMRRWYGGAWQNVQKHHRIVTKVPGAALVLPLLYVEGLIFVLMFFCLPLINILLFFKVLFLYVLIEIGIALYAAVRRRRWELALYGPLYISLSVINAYVFMEQFFLECVFHRKNMVWFHPERTARISVYEAIN